MRGQKHGGGLGGGSKGRTRLRLCQSQSDVFTCVELYLGGRYPAATTRLTILYYGKLYQIEEVQSVYIHTGKGRYIIKQIGHRVQDVGAAAFDAELDRLFLFILLENLTRLQNSVKQAEIRPNGGKRSSFDDHSVSRCILRTSASTCGSRSAGRPELSRTWSA